MEQRVLPELERGQIRDEPMVLGQSPRVVKRGSQVEI